MVVMCAWLFDIALSAVLNAGRFDLGFYAGRIYGLLAASFVLRVLLLENGAAARTAGEAHAEERQRALELQRVSGRLRADQCAARRESNRELRGADAASSRSSSPTCRTSCARR